MKNTIVIDLDGTLANVDHRTHLVKCEKPRWDEFFKECINDSPNWWCMQLMAAFKGYGYKVLIVTARKSSCRGDTKRWLKDHGVLYDQLIFVRADEIYTKDEDLKRDWLRSYGSNKILFVVDDRQRVVDMWRDEGVTCLQCEAWEEYKKP